MMFGSSISTSSFLCMCGAARHRCRAAHPGGLSCQIVGFEPFAPPTEGSGAPKFAGAERRARWPALRQDRSRLRTGWPIHDADRRAFQRSTAAFFLRPQDRLLGTDRGNSSPPLIPRGFLRVHPPPPVRCRTDPPSWARQCLPRPPEMSLRSSSAGATPHSANKRHRLTPSASRVGS